MKVSRVSEMRALDRAAIEQYGIREELLMENAGQAAYFVLLNKLGVRGRRFVVFCGIGNNGGDGFVVARKIHSMGGRVKIFILGDREKFKGAARMNLEIADRLALPIERVASADAIRTEVLHTEVILDAIFGTGLVREVGGLYAEVIGLINRSGKTVLSVDIPSGVHGDTGKVMGTAVHADVTVTFGLPKIGNLLYPGYDLCGELYVTHISFPPALIEAASLDVALNRPPALPPRDRAGHKGDFGEALFIAGASSYFGAPYFAALSFLKAGGGYSRLAVPRSLAPFIANRGSEIVFLPQRETNSGSMSLENRDDLLTLSENMDLVVLGPGLSLDEETRALAGELAGGIQKPLVIDGDGITALCRDLDIIRQRKAPTILTPHLGEMSRITQRPVSDIDGDKVGVLQKTARDLNAILVLKGAHTLIGYPNGRVYINLSGNAGMATAGSGDVLTGTIGAMFGMGLPLEEAVRKGVFMHGLAGDLAADTQGEDGMTAQDILDHLPPAVKMDREGLDEDLRWRYEGAHPI